MVDSEYSMNIYKTLKKSIGTVMRNPEMLKIVTDHLKTKKMCKYVVKKLPFQYKTQQMFDKAILENGGTLTYVLDCYKNQEMCNKGVDNYPYSLDYVPECYKTQKMGD